MLEQLIRTRLELQTLQKQQHLREQLQQLQNALDSSQPQIDENFDGSTTVADDIIVLSRSNQLNDEYSSDDDATRVGSQLSLNEGNDEDRSAHNLNQQSTITNEFEDSFDTKSISTIDETNNSSTNSIITEINFDRGTDNQESFEQIAEHLAYDTNNAFDPFESENQLSRIEVLNNKNEICSTDTIVQNKINSNDNGNVTEANAAETKSLSSDATAECATNPSDLYSFGASDYADEKEALESFDRIIEEESKLLNDTDILREEELIELKQRCIKLTDDNVALQREVEGHRLNSNKQFTLLMYTAMFAAFIGYLFSLFF